MIITIRRDDFNGNRDSERIEYFDYILNSLNINQERSLVDGVDLEVTGYTLRDVDGERIAD